jgi:hypothetical protein
VELATPVLAFSMVRTGVAPRPPVPGREHYILDFIEENKSVVRPDYHSLQGTPDLIELHSPRSRSRSPLQHGV